MKKMKQILTIIAASTMLFSFSACSDSTENNSGDNGQVVKEKESNEEDENSTENGKTSGKSSENEESDNSNNKQNDDDDSNTTQLPSAPKNLSATISSSGFNLSWSAASNATSYEVYYNPDSNSISKASHAGSTTNLNIELSAEISAFANSTIYWFVFAKNSAGQSSNYASSSTYIPSYYADDDDDTESGKTTDDSQNDNSSQEEKMDTTLSVPIISGIIFTSNESGLTIKWKLRSPDSKVTKYYVYRAETKNAADSAWKKIDESTSRAYDDNSVDVSTPNKSYFYRIAAVSNDGVGKKSNARGVTLTYPQISIGHGKSKSSESYGYVKITFGDREHKEEFGKTWTKEAKYGKYIDLWVYGQQSFKRSYYLKKSDGSTVIKTANGEFEFKPSHKYQLDCTTGKVSYPKTTELTIE